MAIVAKSGLGEAPLWRRLELPTWAVWAAVHGLFFGLTWYHELLPAWLVAALGAWTLAWQGSLQHEAVHGHPTRWPRLNGLLAGLPLSLWLPYSIYRDWHSEHHRAEILACPLGDPESFYVTSRAWARAGPGKRWLLWSQQTLLGRLLLGPPCAVAVFLAAHLSDLLRGERRYLMTWMRHAVAVALLLGWLYFLELSIGFYVLFMVWPGLSLTMLRSFHEHRPDGEASRRSATVAAAAPLALLYLNNNLHAAHHLEPGRPWYELPELERQLSGRGEGYPVAGYGEIFRRYLVRAKDAPVYPL